MTPEQNPTTVRVPARKPHPSRTPVRQIALEQPVTPAIADGNLALTAPTPTLPGIRSRAPSAQTEAAASSTTQRPNIGQPASSGLEPQTAATAGTAPIIDVSDDDVGDAVPSTPPELRQLPTKRTIEQALATSPDDDTQHSPPTSQYRTMITQHVNYNKIQDNAYHLDGYHKMAHAKGMKVWARLDFNTDKQACLQTTHASGPSKSSIQHRRVLDFTHGHVLHDQPYSADQDGQQLFPDKHGSTGTRVTELWYIEPITHSTAASLMTNRWWHCASE